MMTKWLEWMFVTFLNEKAISLVLQYGNWWHLCAVKQKTSQLHVFTRKVEYFLPRVECPMQPSLYFAGLQFPREVYQRAVRVVLQCRASRWQPPWQLSSNSSCNSFKCSSNNSNKTTELRSQTLISTKRIWVCYIWHQACDVINEWTLNNHCNSF